MFFSFKNRRRDRLRRAAFPQQWNDVLRRFVPAYWRLTDADQGELRRHMQVFLAEKRFEGCAGFEITDAVRVTIAALACLLLLHRDTDYYPRLDTILVYPHRYFAKQTMPGPGGVVSEGYTLRAGESWHGALSAAGGGPVVLSWEDVLAGAAAPHDGNNVVLHEFAHQLDAESGAVEGAPQLEKRSAYSQWARVLGGEFDALRREVAMHRPTLLGSYAASSPAEFFAVATERFFERSCDLRRGHPDLYRQLSEYYRQDPAVALCADAALDQLST